VKTEQISKWIADFKHSWETQDAGQFVSLFTENCEYRDTPFMEPVLGPEFRAFWEALAKRQQENHIDFQICGQPSPNRVIATWQATTRAAAAVPGTWEHREGNGVVLLTFDDSGRCSDFFEWQHWHVIGTPLDRRAFTWKAS